MEIINKSFDDLHSMLVNKEVSCTELTKAFRKQMHLCEPRVRAFLAISEDTALLKAAEVDKKIANNESIGPLEGLPTGLKDNICMQGIPTTCGSHMLKSFLAPYDATVTKRLKDAGAIILGKLNLDEFAMGSTTESSAFHPTYNPWDLKRVPGGSSGGSAAAVSACEVAYSLGSDTGGSIRQPASFCGVVGLKPTYGRVSRYGVVAVASSLDHVGILSKTVGDNAQVLNAIAGYDPQDPTSITANIPDYTQFLENNVKGLKIGVPKEFFSQELTTDKAEVINKALETLEQLGAEIEECSLPHMDYAMAAYYIIAMAEASSELACFDGVRYGHRAEANDMIEMFKKTRAEGFGPEVKRRIMLGTYVLSSGHYEDYYLKAQKVRTLIKEDFNQVFSKYDALLGPTNPQTAPKIGESSDPLAVYLEDIFTIPANLAGLPALSIPAGFVQGLPFGMQLIGKHFDEGLLYRIAYTFEQNTDHHHQVPVLLREVN
jgi:aspartyl-tRNA(Asn)/glutamyl-tRNA(Gln) amidotransferase subunit A